MYTIRHSRPEHDWPASPQSCAGCDSVKTVAACVIGMPVSVQMGHSYTSYINTDHILAPIRRLRAELSNLFTPSVYIVNKCSNVNCPSNKKTDRCLISPPLDRYSGKVGQNTENRGNAGKTALTRRKSCPAGHHSNLEISRPHHQFKNKVRVILFHSTIFMRDLLERYFWIFWSRDEKPPKTEPSFHSLIPTHPSPSPQSA